MRCLIHDFAGHPFQVQLSRELARRGHHVTHAYPFGLDGPKGRLTPSPNDSATLDILGIPLSGSFRKYSAWRRLAAQRIYARDVKRLISSRHFDVMISGNTPIDVQAELLWYCKAKEIGFVHWVQDVYSQAIRFFLERKVGAFAAPVSYPFLKLEQWVATRADAAVAIAPAFADILAGWGVPRRGISVIENWAPLDEVRPLPRINEWSTEHGLNEKTVFLYSGTLGMKHRPDLLYHLAKSLKNNCKLVVVTEGIGREYLRKLPPLDTIQFLDFQPYDQLPMVLASADVLVATLESDAGQFAVPSKVLSYMCAGRPLLLAAPAINLAAAVVRRSRAGIVANPDSPEDVCAAAQDLSTDLFLRSSLGASARRYAEREFNISRIAFRFEEVLLGSVPARARVEGVVDRRRSQGAGD